MRSSEVILQLLKEQNVSQRRLAKAIGTPPQTVNHQLSKSKDLKMDDFAAMLDALGYEMKIVPKSIERPEFTLDARSGEIKEVEG